MLPPKLWLNSNQWFWTRSHLRTDDVRTGSDHFSSQVIEEVIYTYMYTDAYLLVFYAN